MGEFAKNCWVKYPTNMQGFIKPLREVFQMQIRTWLTCANKKFFRVFGALHIKAFVMLLSAQACIHFLNPLIPQVI